MQWRELESTGKALAIFQGPDAYVSPSLYPSKARDGRVVPTWNYVAVHAWGSVRVFEDANELRSVIERLTDRHEKDRAAPWRVDGAPEDFIAGTLRAIVGFEITIERLEGQWKVSQNRSPEDRRGVKRSLSEGPSNEVSLSALIPD